MNVAVAVIVNQQQRILITQRPLHVPHGGYWEFPGGKLESGESSGAALIREVAEEVGLAVHQYHLLGEVEHQYPDNTVKLFIFLVTQFMGNPVCLEGQLAMEWVKLDELDADIFPKANHKVIALIKNHLSTAPSYIRTDAQV